MSWPGVIKKGTRYKEFIQNIDYAPTMIDAAGLEVPETMQGISMMPVLKGKAKDWRKSVYYHYYERDTEHNCPRHEGVRTDRYKLINFYDYGEYNLFDMVKDPDEMRDVSKHPAYRTILQEMKQELARLRKEYKAPELKPYPPKPNGPKI